MTEDPEIKEVWKEQTSKKTPAQIDAQSEAARRREKVRWLLREGSQEELEAFMRESGCAENGERWREILQLWRSVRRR